MSWSPPNPLPVIMDTREKKPESFPGILTWNPMTGPGKNLIIEPVREKLITGDYAVRGFHNLAAVEKKGSIEELYSCVLGKNWSMFTRQLDRLAELPYAMLLLTMPLHTLTCPGPYSPKPDRMMDRFFRMTAVRRLPVYFVPPGRNPTRTGSWIIRWLLGALVCYHAENYS
ncbi:hypothetical protein LCGC14_0901800 [marine sediment metagenome]|uniref:Uncharacterized protein n=1 Tax=marine sediment metagenome TaxID=412755 RepID=A0A0F9RF94_9ZZZZ